MILFERRQGDAVTPSGDRPIRYDRIGLALLFLPVIVFVAATVVGPMGSAGFALAVLLVVFLFEFWPALMVVSGLGLTVLVAAAIERSKARGAFR